MKTPEQQLADVQEKIARDRKEEAAAGRLFLLFLLLLAGICAVFVLVKLGVLE